MRRRAALTWSCVRAIHGVQQSHSPLRSRRAARGLDVGRIIPISHDDLLETVGDAQLC